MTGGCWWSRDIAAKFKSINQSSFLFENEKRWIDLIWICGASRPREQSSPSIHSGMNCWLLFLRRVDGWVGLLFLILVGYGRCSANGSAKERKQTNKPTIQQQNKGKRTQFVFADSNTEWNEVCGGGERRQTSGAPTAGRQVHSFLQLLFRFNWRIKKLSEKKWFRFQLMALFIHQKRKHFSFFDWIELRERKTNKFNQSFHSFMRMKIDEFCFSFFSFSLPLCGIKRIEMLLKEKEELIKGMKVNQWSGIELNQSHSAPFDWFLSFPRSVNQWNQTICLSGIDEARQGAMNKANHFFQSIHKFDELMKKWIDLWMKRVIGRRPSSPQSNSTNQTNWMTLNSICDWFDGVAFALIWLK